MNNAINYRKPNVVGPHINLIESLFVRASPPDKQRAPDYDVTLIDTVIWVQNLNNAPLLRDDASWLEFLLAKPELLSVLPKLDKVCTDWSDQVVSNQNFIQFCNFRY